MLEVEHLRQQANNLFKVSGADRENTHAFAHAIVNNIDKYTNNLSPKDIMSGNAQSAADTVKGARNLWSRFKKAQKIDNIVTNAEDAAGANFSQAGAQTAIRQGVRGLLKRINQRQEVGWSPAEVDALRRVTRGDVITNTTRLVGKLAPHGTVSALSGGILGAHGVGALLTPILGPGLAQIAGAGLTYGAGEVGHRIAGALTQSAIQHARDVAASGGKLGPLPKMLTTQSAFGLLYGTAPVLPRPNNN